MMHTKRKWEQTRHGAQTKKSKRNLDDSENVQILSRMPAHTVKGEVSVQAKKKKSPAIRGKRLAGGEVDNV